MYNLFILNSQSAMSNVLSTESVGKGGCENVKCFGAELVNYSIYLTIMDKAPITDNFQDEMS